MPACWDLHASATRNDEQFKAKCGSYWVQDDDHADAECSGQTSIVGIEEQEASEPDDVKAERQRAEALWNQMQLQACTMPPAILLVGLRKVLSDLTAKPIHLSHTKPACLLEFSQQWHKVQYRLDVMTLAWDFGIG